MNISYLQFIDTLSIEVDLKEKKEREGNNTARYPSLRDKVVVISGGADGIGADIARAFATQQAKVVIVDIAADKGRVLQGNRMSGFRSHFYMLTDLETN